MREASTTRRPWGLGIAVPASLASDTAHLREKTMRIGTLGRAAAIFRAKEIIVYADRHGVAEQREDGELAALILSYMETPQYLRKRLYPRVEALRYAGILPPLRTSHHPLSSTIVSLRSGELREGVVLESSGRGRLVDVGVETPITYTGTTPPGNRITVQIRKSEGFPRAEPVTAEQEAFQSGYVARFVDRPLGQLVREGDSDLVVATSRHGNPVASLGEALVARLRGARSVLVLFGSPKEGLREILAREGLTPQKIADFVVNMVPQQGTETVRTEEAVLISLGAMNILAQPPS